LAVSLNCFAFVAFTARSRNSQKSSVVTPQYSQISVRLVRQHSFSIIRFIVSAFFSSIILAPWRRNSAGVTPLYESLVFVVTKPRDVHKVAVKPCADGDAKKEHGGYDENEIV
jgi:hypothetical protein